MQRPLTFAEIFHEATKYTAVGLDMRLPREKPEAPDPVKAYEDCERTELRSLSADSIINLKAAGPNELSLERLSQLLFLTNGVTGILEFPGPDPLEEPEQIRLRAAPSAGGLYPTEIYLALPEREGFKAGLYNYNIFENSLVMVQPGSLFDALARSTDCPELIKDCQGLMILTCIYERSAWRYEDRGYRRILLDTGHVLGNALAVAQEMGFQAWPVAGFVDEEVVSAMMLDHHLETPLVLLPLLTEPPEDSTLTDIRRRSLASKEPKKASCNTSLMRHLHRLSAITRPFTRAPGRDMAAAEAEVLPNSAEDNAEALEAESIDWPRQLVPTVLKRRSTRTFKSEPISATQLATILHEGQRFAGELLPDLLETYVVVLRVEGLRPGLYRYRPEHGLLQCMRLGQLDEEIGDITLGQEIARDGAAVVLHSTSLPRAVTLYGERAYRYLHLEAGLRGQLMNLAAIQLGLGVSGIGGFFDNEASDFLNMLPHVHITVYLTTLGVPSNP